MLGVKKKIWKKFDNSKECQNVGKKMTKCRNTN